MSRLSFSSSLLQRLFCSAILISCLAGIALPAHAQFETRATAAFPQGAYSIAEGDFNNDGNLDVVVLVDEGFAIALGNGDGTFQKPVFHHTTTLAYSLAVGDFNGDGNLDIVSADLGPTEIQVYRGNGDGTFKAPISSKTTEGSYFVVVGDFNGDKKLDLAIIDPPYISTLLGNGDGTFRTPSDNNSFDGAEWIAVGDFNNDLKLDVIVVGEFGTSYDMGVLLGNGDGTLQDSITTPLEYVPGAVAVGDLSSDGNLDAVVGSDLGGIVVFLGNGDGSFQGPSYYSTTGVDGGQSFISDLNLDGKLDVAMPSGAGIDVFWGNGDGTLQPAQFFASGESGWMAEGDLNNDGLPDFALATSFYTTTMLNTGVVSISPTTAPLTFPSQTINTVSKQQSLKLKNQGKASISISSMKLTGPFAMKSSCGKSLAAGAACSLSVTFDPKAAGTANGLITINDGASSKPQFVDLTGTATAVEVAPVSLTFPSENIGKRSVPQIVTAINEGKAAITFNSVYIGGKDDKDFSATGNCTGSLAPGASCQMSVTFDPTEGGPRSAALYFELPTGSISPAPVALSGTGL
jgi:FG-GAP-like repeat/Abnormal spindle-like microcephaly-assoc'd, ASPM-SPD-2-Hydin